MVKTITVPTKILNYLKPNEIFAIANNNPSILNECI